MKRCFECGEADSAVLDALRCADCVSRSVTDSFHPGVTAVEYGQALVTSLSGHHG